MVFLEKTEVLTHKFQRDYKAKNANYKGAKKSRFWCIIITLGNRICYKVATIKKRCHKFSKSSFIVSSDS